MKKMYAILAGALLSPYAMSRADAEGPLHWTARHLRNAAVDTGDTISNAAHRSAHDGSAGTVCLPCTGGFAMGGCGIWAGAG
jgi:hypothetical protein